MEYNETPHWAGEKGTPPANFNIRHARIGQGNDPNFKFAYLLTRMLTELEAFRIMLPDQAAECASLEHALGKLSAEEFMKRHYETERQL